MWQGSSSRDLQVHPARYRSAGTLLSHEQPSNTTSRKHRLEKELTTATANAALYHTLRERGAIKTYRVGYVFWRSVFEDHRKVSRTAPGHWYYPDSQKKQLYTDETGSTIIKAVVKKTIRLLKVRKIFSCPQSSYDYQIMPDGSLSQNHIANPRPRAPFRQFSHHPFIKKAREMMMIADDNIMSDAFRLHKIQLPDLQGFKFHGLTLLCDGDPVTIGSRKGEVWISDVAASMYVKKMTISSYQKVVSTAQDTDDDT